MDESRPDFFVSNEDPVEVDAETAAALERRIKEADEGRLVPSDEVRKMVSRWISNFSTRHQR
jgi:predicted transcriptional regulator